MNRKKRQQIWEQIDQLHEGQSTLNGRLLKVEEAHRPTKGRYSALLQEIWSTQNPVKHLTQSEYDRLTAAAAKLEQLEQNVDFLLTQADQEAD